MDKKTGKYTVERKTKLHRKKDRATEYKMKYCLDVWF